MKCTEVSSLLVDFLYEEMPADQRREFLAHVEGCSSCSAEVKAMSSTLGHARAALRGPLAEEPPPGVRARVLEAARSAETATAAKLRPARVPDPEGFFARLWKTPWLVPALGAAGVATAVFLVKVIKNPQVLPEQKPAVIEALTQPVAAPQALKQAQPRPEADQESVAAPATPAQGLASKPSARSERDSQVESKRAAAAGKPHFAPPDRESLASSRRHVYDDPLAGVSRETRPRAPVDEAAARKGGGKAVPPGDALADAKAKRAPAPAIHANKDETALDDLLRSVPGTRKAPIAEGAGSSGRWAEPPPPRAAGAPAATAPAAAKLAPIEKAEAIADLEDRAGSRVAEEPPPSAAPAKVQAPVRAAPASPAAQSEGPADKKKASEKKETISFGERVRKAEKLFAEKKWVEAAAAFRTLLAQAPSNPAAKTWRERLAAAESAQKLGLPARASKAVSSDPLDGL